MTPNQVLDLNLGFATRTQLRDAGATDAQIKGGIAAGQLVAVGRHVVARRGADADLLRAARMGARLACVSAALHREIWAIDDARFHVAPRALNSHSSADALEPPAVLHWTRRPVDPAADLLALESVANMLMHVAKCQPLDSPSRCSTRRCGKGTSTSRSFGALRPFTAAGFDVSSR